MRTCATRRRAPASASCSKARSWTASRSSTSFARRCRPSTSSASKASSTRRPTTSSRRWKQGQSFDDALARMQAEGIAEADPSLDVDGWDAAAKTAALANVLMDARITPHDVAARPGSTPDTGEARARGDRQRAAAEAGGVGTPRRRRARRLHASSRASCRRITCWRPRRRRQRLDPRDRHAATGSRSASWLGSLTQTAYALLSDIIAIARGAASRDRHRSTASPSSTSRASCRDRTARCSSPTWARA